MSNIFQFLFFTLVVLIPSGVLGQSQCDKYDPTSCPIDNGFQKICVCMPFGGGCWCQCPSGTESIEGTCRAKPTKIGEDCVLFSSCSEIEGAAQCPYTTTKKCECAPNMYPMDDLGSCIPLPIVLDNPCSDAASCEGIPGSTCQKDSNLCKCLPDLLPNFDRTSCKPAPTHVGDGCSVENPCSGIPFANCEKQGGEDEEPICQCPTEYLASGDAHACLPTRVGVKCSGQQNSCDYLEGAQCYGESGEARCLCLWSIPNLGMTKCLAAK